ncbi:MAG TPA: UvrD-helicase domain-containing protein [Casimicrobiaceae bacterium]|nr:UvrD-helicase domain-containing protein [Casimicrobiaceae bacterium]
MNDVAGLAVRDDAARAQALDITRSWLVQAPAGSGKTSLLIQRFLALLARVERPERIVAMTFTRKAAAEMRARIVDALRNAALAPDEARIGAHETLTRALARRALDQDRVMGWRLLEQPARLRIVTIDALAAALARQVPLAAGLGALPGFVDDARALHVDAARAALAEAAPLDRHWQAFLQWQDNDAGAATRLIAQMLAARERWPLPMLDGDPAVLRAEVEAVLELEARAAVAIVHERLPASLAAALPRLAQMALDGLHELGIDCAHAGALAALCRDGRLPDPQTRETWCGLAQWLLTQEGTFFRVVTKRHGFPRGAPQTQERARRKAEFVRWLEKAAQVPGLADAWHRLRALPPARFSDDAWAFVAAAMRVLPRAVAALDGVFRARGRADFAEATLRALTALGTPDDPSDLLLAIDYRLSHLLIDEFQDTSSAQLALIGKLTSGWDAGDGRTLFAVGDPMQSIYRFRQADVALFLDAQAQARIGDVPVGVVELSRNFRSQPAIVDFVNDVFRAVLPALSDPAQAEAAYRPAYADPERGVDIAPTLDLVGSRDAEAGVVVQRIRDAQAAGVADIAILVRARSHAQALLPALRRAGIDYSAIDLEGLHDRLATRDLLSLARALAQPADRLAWLSVLRAPWCGLTLADLHVVANAGASTIAAALEAPDAIDRLSSDGRARVARFRQCVAPALASRGQASFTARVKSAWVALGGPACAASPLDRDGADRVFALLAEHERGADLPDFETLRDTAQRLFADAGKAASAAVQVMTLHKAKGLQFGAVILPGLDLRAGRADSPLLRWKVRRHHGQRTLLIAPMRARMGARSEPDPVYAWLGEIDAAEEAAELGRLLYVGATRAKRRLHLVAVASVDSKLEACEETRSFKRPARGSALERLWDALAAYVPRVAPSPAPVRGEQSPPDHGVSLIRLPLGWQLPALPPPLPVAHQRATMPDAPTFDWADATAAAIGTVAHRLLAQVAAEGVAAWGARRLVLEQPRILAELGSEGVEPDLAVDAATRVTTIVARTLRDPRGRWLFDPAHVDAHSEWALAGDDDGRIVHVVLDRSFVAAGRRYVIDFKTGAHLGGDPATFLAREFERYRPQLQRYARIVRAIDARPVRVALYHPLVEGGWQEHELD